MIDTRTAVLLGLGLLLVTWFTLFCSNPMFRARVAVTDDAANRLEFAGSARAFETHDTLDAVLAKAGVNILQRLHAAFPDPTPEEQAEAAAAALQQQVAPQPTHRFTRVLAEMDPALAGGIAAARSAVMAAVPNLPSATL